MALIAIKLVVSPLLVAAVTLTQRRWGTMLGGLLVGLPLTSGPVALFFAIEHGQRFAAAAAVATIAGVVAASGFCIAYAQTAARRSWPVATAIATAVYVPLAAIVMLAPEPLLATYLAAVGLVMLARWAVPSQAVRADRATSGSWDLPARMLITAGLVIGLTAAADGLGSKLSGALSPLPVYAAVLAAFTHRAHGAMAAQSFLRAVLTGNVAFATFFLVLALALAHHAVILAFLLATLTALLLQALVALISIRQQPSPRQTDALGEVSA